MYAEQYIQDYEYMQNSLSGIMDICWTVHPGLWIDSGQFILDYGYILNSLSRIMDIY